MLQSKATISYDGTKYVINIGEIRIGVLPTVHGQDFDPADASDFSLGANDVHLSILNQPVTHRGATEQETYNRFISFKRGKDAHMMVNLNNLKIQEIEKKCLELRREVKYLYEYALDKCQ